MDSIIQADIFFFITGIAVILFASALTVLVIYLVIISRDIKYVVRLVRNQADSVQDDIERMRSAIQDKDWGIFDLLKIFKSNPFSRSKKRKVGGTKE